VKLTVTDSSSPALSQSASHNVVVSPVSGQRDFTISASPTSVTVTGESPLCEGSSTLCDDEAMTTLTLTSVNGFNGTVRFLRSVSPANGLLTVYCRPGAIQLKPGATVTVRCFFEPEINPQSPTTFTVSITGIAALTRFPSHSVIITVTVIHFSAPPDNDPSVSSLASSISVSMVGGLVFSQNQGDSRDHREGNGHGHGRSAGHGYDSSA